LTRQEPTSLSWGTRLSEGSLKVWRHQQQSDLCINVSDDKVSRSDAPIQHEGRRTCFL